MRFESEEELVSALKQNCNEAYKEIVRLYWNKIWKQCLSRTKSEQLADELTTNVFTIVLNKIHTYKGGSELPAWLYIVTSTEIAGHYRRNSRRAQREAEAIGHWQEIERRRKITDDKVDLIDKIMPTLTDEQRKIIHLLMENKTYIYIAKQCGITSTALRGRVYRLRQELRQMLLMST